MAEPYVITIILNTNRREDTLECLASLEASTYSNHKAIVLDNASTDGSVEAIGAAFPTVQIIPLTQNLGYAGNNNVGIEAGLDQGADWVFVLNEDTVLDPDCLAHLVEAGQGDQEIGILGPMVYHHDEPNIIQTAGGMLGPHWESVHIAQNEPDQGQYNQPHLVDWISGCGIMVRRAVIEQVGAIDQRYFYYWEETEWCIRAGKAGWKIMHVPRAKLWHKGVQRDYRPKPSVTYYATRNRLLTLAKHHAPIGAWVFAWGQFLRTLTSWTVKPKWRFMHEHRDAMWRGMVDFLRHRWGQMSSQKQKALETSCPFRSKEPRY
jgi:GT2 family glycosyltransferase